MGCNGLLRDSSLEFVELALQQRANMNLCLPMPFPRLLGVPEASRVHSAERSTKDKQ